MQPEKHFDLGGDIARGRDVLFLWKSNLEPAKHPTPS
jgi:hypothetical protein